MNDLKNNTEVTEIFDELTRKMLSSRMSDSEIDTYLLGRGKLIDSIDAVLDLKMLGLDGRLKCEPTDTKLYPYIYNHRIFGAGIIDVKKCEGLLTTGYTTWSSFWASTTSAAVASAELEAGVVLIMFFREDGLPIGDFRGIPTGSIGIIAGGGAGTWDHI